MATHRVGDAGYFAIWSDCTIGLCENTLTSLVNHGPISLSWASFESVL